MYIIFVFVFPKIMYLCLYKHTLLYPPFQKEKFKCLIEEMYFFLLSTVTKNFRKYLVPKLLNMQAIYLY